MSNDMQMKHITAKAAIAAIAIATSRHRDSVSVTEECTMLAASTWKSADLSSKSVILQAQSNKMLDQRASSI